MRKRIARVHCDADRSGAAAVEMAFVAPFVMLFALAATDLGRVVHAYCAVSNAARCGVEYGCLHAFTDYTRPSWEANVRQAVIDEMQSLGAFQEAALEVTVATTTDDDGLYRVSVVATYPFQSAISWPGLPSQLVLGHRVEMRRTQ